MNFRSIIKKAGGQHASFVGAVVAVLAASASSHASIVVHLNPAGPGHFDWSPAAGSESFLNLLLPAATQLNISTPSSLRQVNQGDLSEVGFGTFEVTTGGFKNFFAIGVDEGTLIDGSATWGPSGFIFVTDFGTEIPEGQQTYLGVRFNPGDGLHYGWVGVERTGLTLDAFAWGYETEIGVGIAAGAGIPAPGALSLLALAGVAGRRRRRA